jgi:competence ComEA-like helix-hairpin-helix protein
MKIRELLAEYFVFSRKERIAAILLVIVILSAWFLPDFIPLSTGRTTTDTAWLAMAKKLEEQGQVENNYDKQEKNGRQNNFYDKEYGNANDATGNASLFYFDPNTASEEDWKKLGIKEKTIHTIKNYLQKGGHFKSADDLEKVYGLNPGIAARLIPFVHIGEKENDQKESTPSRNYFTTTTKSVTAKIDINLADTAAWIALPGIGQKLASRMVNFRERLGGFYSVAQVGELYGLADSVFKKIKPFLFLGNAVLHKFNINTATADEMKTHPYIKWNIAKAIVAYRDQHGVFQTLEGLKNISMIRDSVLEKMRPYIFVQ